MHLCPCAPDRYVTPLGPETRCVWIAGTMISLNHLKTDEDDHGLGFLSNYGVEHSCMRLYKSSRRITHRRFGQQLQGDQVRSQITGRAMIMASDRVKEYRSLIEGAASD